MVGGYVLAPRSLVEFMETCEFNSESGGYRRALPAEAVDDLLELANFTRKPLLLDFKTTVDGMPTKIVAFADGVHLEESGKFIVTYGFQCVAGMEDTSVGFLCGCFFIQNKSGEVYLGSRTL